MSSHEIALVAHSGGPTAVINATLLGIYEEAGRHAQISALYGAKNGIAGLLNEEFVDLTRQPRELMLRVAEAPSSALGSSRRELAPEDLERVIAIFRAHNIRYFFYNGGNGSMGTAGQIADVARENRYDLQVIGVPKTIDNDLLETDHAPGYPSAARFFASAVRDIGADNRALSGQVEFIEILGRNVGWLAAATALARKDPEDPPHLIYFPELRLPVQKLLDDVERVHSRLGHCVVAVCEGQLDENGEPFGADTRSGSRGSLAMNLAHRLAILTSSRLRIRARSEKPGLLGRSATSCVSTVDRDEARECGRAAVRAAMTGRGRSMVTLRREADEPYRASTGLVPLGRVALVERLFPAEWRNASGDDVTTEFLAYAAPLVGPIAQYSKLEIRPVVKKMSSAAVQMSSERPAENPPSTTSA